MRLAVDGRVIALTEPIGAPHAGTGYRLETVTSGEDNTEFSVDLLADDHRALGFRVTRQDFPAVSVEVRVASPAAPSRLTVVWTSEIDAPWPASGLLDGGEVSLALNHLPPRHTTGPQLLVTMRHPRLQGRARVLITPQSCQEFVEHFRGLPATPEQLAAAIFDEFLAMIAP